MKYIFSAIFFIFYIDIACSQTITSDSTIKYTDTVVIYKDPLVIRKKVFIAPPAVAEPNWYAEVMIGFGVYKNNFYTQHTNGISEILKNNTVPTYTLNFEVSVYRKFSKLDIGLGVQLCNFKEKFNYDAVKTTIQTTTYLRTDTIDTYYNIINADTNYFYVEETTLQNRLSSRTISKEINATNSSTFVSLPCHIKYKVIDKKLGLQLVAGIIPSMVVAAKGSTVTRAASGYEEEDIKKSNFAALSLSASLGLAMVYPILPHAKLCLQPMYSWQLSNIAAANQPYILKRNRLAIQVGIQFEF